MDIARPDIARKKRMRRLIWTGVAVVAVVAVTAGLSQLKPAAPSVVKANLYIDTVKRGQFVRQVRGTGTLVPEEVRWIPAATDGRVERIILKPGTTVDADSVVLELSNPDLQTAAADADLQLKAAEAELVSLKVRLQSQLFDEQAAAARVDSDCDQARLQAEADEALAKDGLVSDLTRKLSRVRADELVTRRALEQKRLEINSQSVDAQISAQRARVDQIRGLHDLRMSQVDGLRVRAGISGVLQQVAVEVGQRVTAGATLAKVAEPTRLMAEVRIAETQVKDVQKDQTAEIDTRNGIIPGRVRRIDPAPVNGTVRVEVALDGTLPKGARPDLTVDGTITLETLTDVLYASRPAFGQEHSTVGIFRLDQDGSHATRAQVRLGRGSVSLIEIEDGLREGDQVILSDTSAWDAYDRIRLD